MKNMWTRNQGDYTVADIDRWSSPPPDTVCAKWCGGVIVPALILWPGIRAIVTKASFIPGRYRSRLDLQGTDAVLLGCALVCLAIFLHTHYFWGNSRRFLTFHDVGKTASLIGFCVFAIWLVVRLFKDTFGV